MMYKKLAQRDYYGKALMDLVSNGYDIVVLDADLASSTKTSEFRAVNPSRFIEVGIAEQNMIGIASGIAASGKIVFASTFGVFATGRCWEQIRLAIAYPKMDVKIVATHCGISVGKDGASHQALEDIAIMRALPNMVVISPADAYEAYAATIAIADYDGPVYMRMGRAEFPTITSRDDQFNIGKARFLRNGKDITLIGCGQIISFCLDAASLMEKHGIQAEVINMATIKPLDSDAIITSVSKTGCCVTAEEHSIIGGLGSAVAECLSESICAPLMRIGTKDTFGESGSPEDLMKKYNLFVDDIVSAAMRLISMKEKR